MVKERIKEIFDLKRIQEYVKKNIDQAVKEELMV